MIRILLYSMVLLAFGCAGPDPGLANLSFESTKKAEEMPHTDVVRSSTAMTESAIDEVLMDARGGEGYPGISAAVYLKGEAYHVTSAGFADAATTSPPDQDTLFRLYSVTKGLSQILAAVLFDEGLLDLEVPISNYISGLPEHIQPITARQLLLHQAGVRHYQSDQEWLRLSEDHCEGPEDAFGRFINDPLVFQPGAGTSYSSFGYVLLSKVLENAGGKPFEQLMEEKVWSQSSVQRIGFDNEVAGRSNNTTYYEPAGDGYERAPSVDNSCKFGGGGLIAAPKDVAKIFSDFYGEQFTSRATLERFVPAISRPCQAISIGGEGVGGRAVLVAYPYNNLVVVLTANSRGGDLMSYGYQIADLVARAEQATGADCHRN